MLEQAQESMSENTLDGRRGLPRMVAATAFVVTPPSIPCQSPSCFDQVFSLLRPAIIISSFLHAAVLMIFLATVFN